MSKFKSLLEAHQAEVEKQSPVSPAVDPVVGTEATTVAQSAVTPDLTVKSTPVISASTVSVQINRTAPIWEPPMKWIRAVVGVIVLLIVFHFVRLMTVGYGDVPWSPPTTAKTTPAASVK